MTTDPAEEAELLERAGESASAVGHHDRAEAFLRRAIEVGRALGDRGAIARATAALGRAMIDAYRYDAAVDLLEPAIAEFPDPGTDPAVVALHGQLARACMLRYDDRRAIEVADRVLEAAERLDLVEIVADTLVTKGAALVTLGRSLRGARRDRGGPEARRGERPRDDRSPRPPQPLRVPIRRRPPGVRGGVPAALAMIRRLGFRGWLTSVLNNLRSACFRLGDWDAALAELESALGEDLDPLDRAKLLSLHARHSGMPGANRRRASTPQSRRCWSVVRSTTAP